jgi:hypothetical protein
MSSLRPASRRICSAANERAAARQRRDSPDIVLFEIAHPIADRVVVIPYSPRAEPVSQSFELDPENETGG